MRIGFLGTGKIGGTLARLFAAHDHQLEVANSRGPQTLSGLVAELGDNARAVTAAELGANDVVVLAVPFGKVTDLPADALDGTIVIDANNYYPDRDGRVPELDAGAATSTGLTAAHFGKARVVKAFNAMYYVTLGAEGRPDLPADQRLAIPIAGDDADAKATVAALIAEIGFTAVDAGSLADSHRLEPGSAVYGASLRPDEAAELLTR